MLLSIRFMRTVLLWRYCICVTVCLVTRVQKPRQGESQRQSAAALRCQLHEPTMNFIKNLKDKAPKLGAKQKYEKVTTSEDHGPFAIDESEEVEISM